MAESVTISGADLFRHRDTELVLPSSSPNSTIAQGATSAWGGSAHLTCAIKVENPGDSDRAFGGVESTWGVLAEAPGSGPFSIGLSLGAVSLRAKGKRNNEWGFSSHEVYGALRASARVVHPDVRTLQPNELNTNGLISFWNVDVGPQNEARMRRRTRAGTETVSINQS